MTSRTFLRYSGIYFVLFAATLLLALPASAVPPTQDAIDKWKADGTLDQKLAAWKAFHEAGGDSPSSPSVLDMTRLSRPKSALDANAVDTINAVVLMVDFSDWPGSGQLRNGTPAAFDSILFSDRRVGPKINPTGSLTDFYIENSYGKLFVHGEVYGWYRMPQTYAYYVNGSDNGLTRGSLLARDAVIGADPTVDYTKFATGGVVNGVIIIHAGPGAETGAYGIWSHKSTISGQPVLDGVQLSAYTLNPEEFSGDLTPIGVYCHEYGHVLGLPDLYDVDYTPATSEGLGSWSLMASGSYNGESKKPSHLDAWCKKQLGFLTYTNVPSNQFHVPIPAVEYSPTVYQIKDTNLVGAKEFWLVENRQSYGSDAALPGFGLLIYHIDENVSGNNNYLRYEVALEQSDGLNQLALGGSRGDGNDPWPGGLDNRNFTDVSIPNSRSNVNNKLTEVGVWNISNSDSIMYANLDFTFSHPQIAFTGSDSLVLSDVAGGNGNGVIEAGETIALSCRFLNTMRSGYNWYMTLSTANPDVQFINNHTQQTAFMSRTSPSVPSNNPVRFTFAPGAKPTISDFTLTITVDSVNGSGDEVFSKVFTFAQPLGKPNVLIVDDDGGASSEDGLTSSFTHLKMPQTVWHKTSGSPAASLLQQHRYVFWMSGEKPTGSLTAADVSAMKTYLNGGGHLAIASATAAAQLKVLDSAFMRDYLHARYKDSVSSGFYFYGVAGNPISEDSRYRYLTTVSSALRRTTIIDPTSDGLLTFEASNRISGTPYLGHCGVMYSGSYKTVLMTFALEYISDRDTLSNYLHRDSLTVRILRFFDDSTTVYGIPQVTKLAAAGELPQNILSATPTFAWSYFTNGINAQDSAEIEFGTNADWSVAELWNPAIITGSDTTAVYAGSPLADGSTFYMRARVHTPMAWSGWYQSSFRMNSAPPIPSPITPAANGILGSPGSLVAQSVTDAEGDVVSYQFSVYVESTLVTQEYGQSSTNSSAPIPLGYLTENARRWWQVRSYDGLEYSPWSSAIPFWVDQYSQSPNTPTDLVPSGGAALVYTLKPSFYWVGSADSDPYDTTKYNVELAANQSFTGEKTSGQITDTLYVFPDSLTYGTHYWWRVSAKDRTGTTVTSSVVNFWTWRLGDLNGSHVTDLSDLSLMIAYLTGNGIPAITPKMVGDLTGDCKIDLSDLSYLISYLTGAGATLRPGC